ncbi:hypothetical protein [Methylobacterium gnaphalii]|uniref:Uncharacterized protein n=1 Tax=Methylobacterium gnaphalii TaxID=1010610 RepID=A0A512JP79_9HYPH|nr:hypothetical protein [Methylobacterium gnaphalii]GEP11766.1 hypothetical protein MGN01_36110 [Methylobacterium gnaphalii]GJD69442.1 hypothetical protein MMMDOFMJ_2373 [Methylobacterium gnaphalii]GLS49599.1 hypothetical protein GCM10007885_24480 [Methylobacterium gnaphalii]
MGDQGWHQRLREHDLELVDLARLTGRSLVSTRDLIRKSEERLPVPVFATVAAWELMNREQREEWLAAVDREAE